MIQLHVLKEKMKHSLLLATTVLLCCSCKPSQPSAAEIKKAFTIEDSVHLKVRKEENERSLHTFNELFGGDSGLRNLIWTCGYGNETELQNDIGLFLFERNGLFESKLFEALKVEKVKVNEELDAWILALGFGDGGAASGTAFRSSNGKYDVLITLVEDFENPARPKDKSGWDITKKGIEVIEEIDTLL